MDRQSEENTNAEEMKTDIYVTIESVENVTLPLGKGDRKVAKALFVEDEDNYKECKADYADSDVRQEGDPFSDKIDVKQNKKGASSEDSEIKNDNDENKIDNLIEKNYDVSAQKEMTNSDSKEKIKDSDNLKEVGNVRDEYTDWSDIECSKSMQTNSLLYQEKESEEILLGQEKELLADTDINKEMSHNIEYDDLETETGDINETEDMEGRNKVNGIRQTEGNAYFQIESVHKAGETHLVEANESGITADDTEDCEINYYESMNTFLYENLVDVRKEQKGELNYDLEIRMNTTIEEIKLDSEEQESIGVSMIANAELSAENNEVTFQNCLLHSKTETEEKDETEDIEERKIGYERGKTEEPAENSDFKIQSVHEEEATKQVGANESGHIADENEKLARNPNEPQNQILDKNYNDERKKQEESNIDLENTMNVTNVERKLYTEEEETIKDMNANTELSKENNEVIFGNDLLDSKMLKLEQLEMKTSEEWADHKRCQENLKNFKMDEDETHTNLSGENYNIEEYKEDLFEEDTSKRKVLLTDNAVELIGNVDNSIFKHQAQDDKHVDTINTESRSETEEMIESTPNNMPETESINYVKCINSDTELLLKISVDNEKQEETSQYYQYRSYSEETFQDELVFAASIVADEAGDARYDWKEGKERERNWLKMEGTKARKPHEAKHIQSPILSWLPIMLLIMIMSYMVMMVMRMVEEKNKHTDEVSVQMNDDLLDQFTYFDIMKWP